MTAYKKQKTALPKLVANVEIYGKKKHAAYTLKGIHVIHRDETILHHPLLDIMDVGSRVTALSNKYILLKNHSISFLLNYL